MSVDLLRSALPDAADEALSRAIGQPRLRGAAADALVAARARPTLAGPTLARWFRQARQLGSKERPIVQEAVFGVLRHQALLERAGAHTPVEAVDAWARLVGGERFDALQSEGPVPDLATALSLPQDIAAEWLEALGAQEAAALAGAFSGRAPLCIRANRARTGRDALARRLLAEGLPTKPSALAPDGLLLQRRANLPELGSWREGLFEVQDEASQLLIDAIPLQPGQRVLDLCAGGGGKSLGLAARGARVRAWDSRPDALRRLVERARRAGAAVSVGEPRPAPVVLVDAPCSGIGRLRRDPALRLGLDPSRHLDAQAALLALGASLVEPGGLLVYATCSLLKAENEAPAPIVGWAEVGRRWLWPHREGTDGFFWAIWRAP